MPEPPRPLNEAQRLEALTRLGILDTPPELAFDQIVAEAAEMAEAPISMISFVTDDRQWFKACVGLPIQETERNAAFCTWAIYNAELLCVDDAEADDRFRDNPQVVGDPKIRAYAGAPIESPDGFLLGALCVIDQKPRSFDPAITDKLQELASKVSHLLAHWTRKDDTAIREAEIS